MKRKATLGAPAKAVKRKTKLTPQDTRWVDGNPLDMNGNCLLVHSIRGVTSRLNVGFEAIVMVSRARRAPKTRAAPT
jgi:hypothetical protein